MKKALYVLIILMLALGIFSVLSKAEESSAPLEYIISEEQGKYTLKNANELSESIAKEDNIEDLLQLLPERATVIFDNVFGALPLEFSKGSYTLTGSLTLSGNATLSVSEGTSLTFDGLTLKISEDSEGYIRIKGGSVKLNNSTVFGANGGAFLLDYAPTSSLILNSGTVSCNSSVGTVRIQNGALTVKGGSISNSGGVAIKNKSSLTLSASPDISGLGYDIESEGPISLSLDMPYLSEEILKIRYMESFSKGTLTEVFYLSSPESTKNILLSDIDGRAYETTYFDSCQYSEEKNFSAVYLPYTVTYLSDGEVYLTEYKLNGDTVTEPQPKDKFGYIHTGWYKNSTGSERYSFGEAVSSDITLYEKYRLNPPSFSAKSYSAVYDGKPHTLSLTSLEHELSSLGGFFTYKWYKDGVFVSSAESLSLSRVLDSGVYSCEITFYYSSDFVTLLADNIVFRITKAEVALPEILPKYYNGSHQSPSIAESPRYSVSCPSGINVGSYPVELSLTDPENYKWQGNDERVISIGFEILQAENFFQEEISINNIYLGLTPTPIAYSKFGNAYFVYSDRIDGVYTENIPSLVGSYYVRALVTENVNYKGLMSEPVAFQIMPDEIDTLELLRNADKLEYTAFEHFDGKGLIILAKYKSGREERIDMSELTATYQNGDSFLYGDLAVNLSYQNKSYRLPITVKYAEYDISSIDFSSFSVIYNGYFNTLKVPKGEIVGLDGYPLNITVNGGGTDAGVYNITVDFYSQSTNYKIPESKTVIMTVTPYRSTVLWGEKTFTYDGEAHIPKVSYFDVFGVERPLSAIGSATDAGDSYVARVENIKNYELVGSECTFVIQKADYDLSEIVWTGGAFVYDGEEKSVSVSNLPEGLYVVGYTDGAATSAGSYTATVSFSYDEKNYNPPKSIAYVWTIHKAEYDISGIGFSDGEFVYDGKAHAPNPTGAMPVGADGIALEAVVVGSATEVSEGAVAVQLVFNTQSQNYRAPEPLTATVKIIPKGIMVEWSIGRYVYNGSEQKPIATAAECEIAVSEGGVNAGEHTVIAKALSDNYTVINSDASYIISKAENYWINPPQINDYYTSSVSSPLALAYYGEPEFCYYSDLECKNSIDSPTSEGVYYMVAKVPESQNYLSLSFEPIEFSVIKVVLLDFSVSISIDKIIAMTPLSDTDFTATARYNDGTVSDIDTALVEIIYENGSSPKKNDSEISFLYLGKKATLPVMVEYADYDLSETKWENISAVYDGSPKSPILTGLPEGIEIVEYVGAKMVNAGEYTVSVRISYDRENYNAPYIAPCVFTVQKCRVELNNPDSVIYNGKIQNPVSPSPLYSYVINTDIVNAGEYRIPVTLVDSENYFIDSENAVYYKVNPIVLTGKVFDINVYLGGEEETARYFITEELVLSGDSLEITQFVENGRVYLKSTNPNYKLELESGEAIQRSYPSPRVTRIIVISSISLLVFLFLLFISIINREKLLDKVAMVRCKWHYRGYKDSPFVYKIYNEEQMHNATGNEKTEDEKTLNLQNNLNDSKNEEENTALSALSENDITNSYDSLEEESHEQSEEDYNEPHKEDSRNLSEPVYDTANLSVDADRADELITDSLAKNLVKKTREVIYTDGNLKDIVNVDTLSKNFSSGERVDVNILKEKGILPEGVGYVKVLARGRADKALTVYANDFSLSAVKMIALTGGEAIKVTSVKKPKE